jgi:hypothetical protein
MHSRFCPLVAVVLLFFMAILPAGAQIVTINASPSVVHIGDTVYLHGTVSGIQTIAVYLFVAGPDLDSRGVTLENLNMPTGRGLFTTAPVDIKEGTWNYPWDTSIILGNMNPGTYTVYVVISPVDRERFGRSGYASVNITFLPSETEATPVPLSPGLAGVALGITIITGSCMIHRLKKQQNKK